MVPVPWTREQVYFSQDDYFRDLIAEIHSANSEIVMETYIFERGVLADRVAAALLAARARGVTVKLLIDGIGSPYFVSDYESQFIQAGVKVRYYRLWPWILRRVAGEPRWWITRIFYRLARINKGNHRKMCIIDRKSMWIGSANVSDVHLKELYGDKAWRDLGVCVEGEDVRIARRAFDVAFNHGLSLRLEVRLPYLLVINQSYYQRQRHRNSQWKRLKDAEKRIWIQTPYFVPLPRVARRLIRKARSGVDVRVLVPAKTDVWVVPWMSISYLQMLAAHGVKVYEYQREFLHQKLYLIDDWICLGSSNLNHRSFLHDLEIDVVITHAQNKMSLEQEFIRDQRESTLMSEATWREYPAWRRAFSWFAGLFAYWA